MKKSSFLPSVILLFVTSIAYGNTYTVTNTWAGEPSGSLGWAIYNANINPGPDKIVFAITGTFNITFPFELTDNSGGTFIDGTSAPGYSGTPVIIINGGMGLKITSANNEVRALQFRSASNQLIQIYGASASGNVITGNYIGTDGSLALNGSTGIYIYNAPNNRIGTDGDEVNDEAERNVISGNGSYGVNIYGSTATGNIIAGNYIGTDATGTSALGNYHHGIIINSSNNNRIGTDGNGIGDITERNIISSNTSGGILMGNASGNVVAGNYIGVDVTGTNFLGNGQYGIQCGGNTNRIGTDGNGIEDGLEGNVVSGNTNDGIFINGSYNIIAGNLVGVDVSGNFKLGNNRGVYIGGGTGNRLGTNGDGISDDQERNIISGNNSVGVEVFGSSTYNTGVAGNYIGTDITGTAALGNGSVGVSVSLAINTRIGTNSDGISDITERNVISGNLNEGIFAQAAGTIIAGNFIGTDITGTSAIGNRCGVGLGGSNIRLGTNGDGINDEAERNIISGNFDTGNVGYGISISGSGHFVAGNNIGTDVTGNAPLGNSDEGIYINNSSDNNIKKNNIAFNGSDGVVIYWNTSIRNRISQNSIFSNGGLGIDLKTYNWSLPHEVTLNDSGDGDAGSNNQQNFPFLSEITANSSNSTIAGTFDSTPNTTFILEFFSNSSADPSGYGEGEHFLGSATVTTDGTGNASFSEEFPVVISNGEYITATATDPSGNTSEYSAAFKYEPTPPSAPSAPDLKSPSDTGPSDTDNITIDNTPTFDITGVEPNSTVTVYANDEILGTVNIPEGMTTGVFTPLFQMADGTYIITAIQTDAAGNASQSSHPMVPDLVIDTSIPTITALSPPDNATGVNACSNLIITFNENIVNWAGNIILKKTIDDSTFETIVVTENKVSVAGNVVTINPAGAFASETGYYVQIGAYCFSDPAGNCHAGISDASSWNFTSMDILSPAVTNVTSNKPDGTYKAGEIVDILVSFSESVMVTGAPQILLETGTEDATAIYSAGSGTNILTFYYTAVTGHFTTDLDYVSVGSLSLNGGMIRDGAGNGANLILSNPGSPGSLGANKSIVIDAIAPDAPSAPDLKSPSDTGPGDADNITNDNTPTFDITGVEPKSTVTVYANASILGTMNVPDGMTMVTFTPVAPMMDGTYVLTATQEDEAGNVSQPSLPMVPGLIIDTSVPVITLKGDNPMIIETGSTYYEPGADVTEGLAASVSGSVNTSVAGTYQIDYNATDLAGNAAIQVSRIVEVVDRQPVASFSAVPNPATCNRSVTFDASTSSPGSPDRSIVSYEWDFGDGTTGTGQVIDHTYSYLNYYTVTLQVTDDNVPPKSASTTLVITVSDNETPSIICPANITVYSDPGMCGASVILDANASDNCSTVTLKYFIGTNEILSPWFFPLNTTCVRAVAADDSGNQRECTFTVTVINAAPSITGINGQLAPVAVKSPVSIVVNYSDNENNVTSAVIDWDDATSTTVFPVASGSIFAAHTYMSAGVYSVTAKLYDACGLTASGTFQYFVVYDPSAGFVTGGGWINSPAGAYTPEPTMTGKASFGFESKYQKGRTVPSGNTEFQFHTAKMNFSSISYEWLVVSGMKAQFKGTGTINGLGNYGFILSAIDGNIDLFRIKIWNKSTGAVIYDNQMGSADNANPSMAIVEGSIVVHTVKSAEIINVNSIAAKPVLLVYPNPFTNRLRFEFVPCVNKRATISLFDVTGRLLQTVFNEEVKSGLNYIVDFVPSTITSGVYFYHMTLGNEVFNGKVIRKE